MHLIQSDCDVVDQFIDALSGEGGNGEDIVLFQGETKSLYGRSGFGQVDFIEYHNLRFLGKFGVVQCQFAANRPIGFQHFIFLPGRHVHQVGQKARPFHMAKELNPQAGPCMSALDQPWNIGHDKGFSPAVLDHTQVWRQCGEWIICDFGSGGGHRRDQRGFSGIGEADQAHVGQQFELEPDDSLAAGFSRLRKPGGLMRGGPKAMVSPSTAAALQQDVPLARLDKIFDQVAGIGVVNEGSCGDFDDEIFTIFTGLAFSLSGSSIPGPEQPPMPERIEGAPAIRGFQDHIAAPAPVPAVRSAAGNEPFAPETHASAAAVAGLGSDDRLVNELHSA
jgi:hypothetical protein